MKEVKIDTISKKVAESWEETSASEAIAIFAILQKSYLEESEKRLRIVLVLLDISWKNVKLHQVLNRFFNQMKNASGDLKEEMEYDYLGLLSLADFAFQTYKILKNFLPEVEVSGQKLYGPADKLGNLSGAEFAFAHSYYIAYLKSKSQEHLNNLIAVLYRPGKSPEDLSDPKYNGDPRIIFNRRSIEERAKIVAALPSHYKSLILTFFRASFEEIARRNPKVFKVAEEKGGSQQTGSFILIIFRLAGPKFGTIEETGQAPLSDILLQATIEIDEQERIQDEIKSRKSNGA